MSYILVLIGFLVLAGTAGASDADLTMSIWQILFQSLIGLLIMSVGVISFKKD